MPVIKAVFRYVRNISGRFVNISLSLSGRFSLRGDTNIMNRSSEKTQAMIKVRKIKRQKILQDLQQVRAVCCAAVAGTTMLGVVVLLIAIGPILTPVSILLASASFSSRSSFVAHPTLPMSKKRVVFNPFKVREGRCALRTERKQRVKIFINGCDCQIFITSECRKRSNFVDDTRRGGIEKKIVLSTHLQMYFVFEI